MTFEIVDSSENYLDEPKICYEVYKKGIVYQTDKESDEINYEYLSLIEQIVEGKNLEKLEGLEDFL